MSPTKVRRVVEMIRGMDVEDALNTCRFSPQAASEPVYKVIASATANAERSDNLRRADLYVSQAFVDQGVTIRRIRPAGREVAGAAFSSGPSHITVVVEPRTELAVRGQASTRSKEK
jgi:large subunit ribosomal protein L22